MTRSSTDSSATNYSLYTTTTRSSDYEDSLFSSDEKLTSSFTIDSSLNNLYPDLPSNFKLLSVLGEGAFSIVYKAINLLTNSIVAVKIINKANLSSKQLRNIKHEINIMKRIKHHGNVIQLLDHIDSINNSFLILEYCNGGEIFDKILEFTYLSEDLSCHIFKQLLNAVESLHNLNIVHRDIKPENLLFKRIPYFMRSKEDFVKSLRKSDDSNKVDEGEFKAGIGGGTIGVIKLADFGLAKQLATNTIAQTPCGTTGYTAPEVFVCNHNDNIYTNNSNSYSKAVDIWSMGCVLYTIMCGFPPFYDENIEVLTDNVTKGRFTFLQPWWDEISADAKDLISKMLNINPDQRITIEEIWQHPWIVNHSSADELTRNYFPHTVDTATSDDDSGNSLAVPKLNQPVVSPRALAIKKVFNNPAMTSDKLEEPASYFIEDIAEEDEDEDLPASEGFVPERGYVRTPFPKEVNFKDVFNFGKPKFDDDDDDDDDEDDEKDDEDDEDDEDVEERISQLNDDEFDDEVSELGDQVGSLNISHFSPRYVELFREDVEEEEGYSTTNSANLDSDAVAQCQTRSSSVISGMNGDFKFTLNLNNSNLLARRKNSVV
ncbi:Serine/threonine-protein kinase srk1 [Candida viswanathii]|uniref:Serine/threonine-protein kinase srk1 n=1 Tax=Candida viswanathii TaxID=5486 RepID=A0A367YDQ3_9ASCO|nr:Serine/threonine-protein kinase srk1 [Candida viswanathii]